MKDILQRKNKNNKNKQAKVISRSFTNYKNREKGCCQHFMP